MATNSSAFLQWGQISSEHSYVKLIATWGSFNESLPTFHLFRPCDDPSDPMERRVEKNSECESDEEIDVETCDDDVVPRPYNRSKVTTVMDECSQHMNLIRLPLENPELEQERIISDCNYQQQTLLSKCLQILREGLLARSSVTGALEEPIYRRFYTDTAAKKVRKLFTDVKWDPHLSQWCHRTLMRTLDNHLLPIYMDILQVLKSKCPALVEQMIHCGPVGEGTNEALKLLLKRPWSPVIGMTPMDKQIHFDPAPLFVTVPHTVGVLGSRRWRLWQIQFNAIGKVFPVMTQEHFRDTGHNTTLRESMETIIQCTLLRVQELKEQFPSRPIVLISWTTACRAACKVAEVERVFCLINLGLPVIGLKHTWNLTNDPFVQCTVPSIFVVGEKGLSSSYQYTEELRQQMNCPTSLVVVHNADDMLRLSAVEKKNQLVTQSMLDRIIQDKIYEFIVYHLPCSLPVESKIPRKRKLGPQEDQSTSYLSSATPNSPIILTAHSPDDPGKFPAINASSAVLRSLLGGVKPVPVPRSSSPVPKMPRIGRPPKLGRPRSKSTTSSEPKPKNSKPSSRGRSKSGDTSSVQSPPPPPRSPNCNGNNSNNASPDTLLSLTKRSLCPIMPITPPRSNVSSTMSKSGHASQDC